MSRFIIKRSVAFLSIALGVCLILPVISFASFLEDIDVNPRASITQAYDDNVTFTNENEKEDFVTTLSAGLDVGWEGKTQSFTIIGNLRQQLYARESAFNNLSQDVTVNFNQEFSKYNRLSLTNTFRHAEEPSSFEDAFGRTAGRYSYSRNNFDMKYTHDLSKQLAMRTYYSNENYNADIETQSDSFQNRFGFDISYFKSSTTIFLLGYDFAMRTLDPGGTAKVNTIIVGLLHFFTSQLYVDARTGISIVEAFNDETAVEPSVAVTLTNDLSETESVSLSFSKTSLPSTDTADIWDAWRVAISLASQVFERLRLSISFFFGKGKYDAFDVEDTQTGVSPRLTYDVSEDIQAFLGYTYSQTDSNIDSRGYERNLVEAGFRVRF